MSHSKRYIELDILRTLAIILMIIYHTAYDLQIFHQWNIDVLHGRWKLLQMITAWLFLLLVGISAAISEQRMQQQELDTALRWHKRLRRTLIIGGAALLISTATYLFDPETYIRFGILHLIATATLLIPIAFTLKEGAIILGIAIIWLGSIINMLQSSTALMLPVGITPTNFHSIDYYPLIPWLGIIYIGIGIGYIAYIRRQTSNRSARLSLPAERIAAIVSWPGRHALIIYVVHQPIILILLSIIVRL